MPTLTAIHNTYTANTPSGVHACLRFLNDEVQSPRRVGMGSATTILDKYPISIVYGYGEGMVMAGDDLDVIPAAGDNMLKRRWWQTGGAATKQRLLPFAGYQRARIVSISIYRDCTEIGVRIGASMSTVVHLSAPRSLDTPGPGPYSVRAIRIHNVDRSEVVPPMDTPRAETNDSSWFCDEYNVAQTRPRASTPERAYPNPQNLRPSRSCSVGPAQPIRPIRSRDIRDIEDNQVSGEWVDCRAVEGRLADASMHPEQIRSMRSQVTVRRPGPDGIVRNYVQREIDREACRQTEARDWARIVESPDFGGYNVDF